MLRSYTFSYAISSEYLLRDRNFTFKLVIILYIFITFFLDYQCVLVLSEEIILLLVLTCKI